jgi:phosphoribosylanthranilate isomerase
VWILQVAHVEDASALAFARAAARTADALLLDSGRPAAAVPELGGTGRAHDWKISREIVAATSKPVFLAGGLTPENVAEAIRAVRPHGVDICSGVRTDGALDAAKLSAFMAAVASA